LRDDFSLDIAAVLRAIDEHNPAVVFLAYPNNPTGNLFDRAQVDQIIARSRGLVVIDEAYHAFADASYMGELGRADNVVVMRTVSKMGLAGLRLGLLAGPPAWLQEFEKLRLPYNINVLTQVSAEFALRHHKIFDAQTAIIRRERAILAEELRRIGGVLPYPSQTNFILFRVSGRRADAAFEGLKQQGILIKNLHRDNTPLAGCLRVTVGTPEENRSFIQALRNSI
jgi:histidinol-phosphate aminotransferase